MSFLYDEKATGPVEPEKISFGSEAGFSDNVVASFRETFATDLLISRPTMIEKARQERRETIERITGQAFEDLMKPHEPEPSVFPDSTLDLESPEERVIADLRETLPPDKAGQILTEQQVVERAREMALETVAENRDVQARSRGFLATAGQFVGAVGAAFRDPVLVATLPFGASSGARLLAAAAIEGAIAGTETAASQPAVQAWRNELGLPSGFGQAVENIALATTIGAGATVALRGLGRGISALSDRKLLRAHRELFPEANAEQRAVREQLERELDVEDDTPFADVPGAAESHAARGLEQLEAMRATQETTDLPEPQFDLLKEPRPAVGVEASPDLPQGLLAWFDPDDVLVDAQRFQFKSGSDAEGVTEALADVEVWDPILAQLVLVWEDRAGRRWIADGHQRRALASRIKKADPDQKPRLMGQVLKEEDGISEGDARAIAAMKNIANSKGDPIDAAKVMRDRPDLAVNLPPREALVRNATGLSRLSDDAFGMVINEVVDPLHASILGRLAPDQPDTHAQVLGILARTNPRGSAEAESVIRDALAAPQIIDTQVDLFGETATPQILYKERARIMSGAARRIKADRAAFATLVREEKRISAAGNQLVTDVNAQRAQQDAEILAYIQKLARRTGPIAEALERAARDLAGGASNAAAVGRFVEDVRSAIATERADGGGAGGGRPGAERGDGGGEGEAAAAGEPAAGARAEPEGEGAEAAGRGAGDVADAQRALRPTSNVTRAAGAVPDDVPQDMFRGFGRDAPAGTVRKPGILGPARYFAFNRESASKFGPQIEEASLRAEMSNPLVIRSDDEWRALTREAGWDVPNPAGRPRAELARMTDAIQEHVIGRGHDGVIVYWVPQRKAVTLISGERRTGETDVGETGQRIKTLKNVFDIPQAAVFLPAATRPIAGAPPGARRGFSDEELQTFAEAERLAALIEPLDPRQAKAIRGGLALRRRSGQAPDAEAIALFEKHLQERQARAGAAQPVEEPPATLLGILEGEPRSQKVVDEMMALEHDYVAAYIRDASAMIGELSQAINQRGLLWRDVNASNAPTGGTVEKMRNLMSELSGAATRVAKQHNAIVKGHKRASQQRHDEAIVQLNNVMANGRFILSRPDQTPGATALDEGPAPAAAPEPLRSATAADEAMADTFDADGPAARAEADALEADMRRRAAQTDFEVDIAGADGGRRSARTVLEDLEQDRQFADNLELCNKT